MLYFSESLDASYRNEDELMSQNKLLTENHEKLLTSYEKEKISRTKGDEIKH